MISTPPRHRFEEEVNTENGKIKVRPEFSISHRHDVGVDEIQSELNKWKSVSLSNPEELLFPGTYNKDAGGYFHTVLPAISRGAVISERKKVQPYFEIHDYPEAARNTDMKDEFWLINEAEKTVESPEDTYMLRGNAVEIDSVLYKGPKADVKREVKRQAVEESVESVDTMEYDGLTVLPVVCNELTRLGEYLESDVDMVVESSYDLPAWSDDYEEFADSACQNDFYILRADAANPEESGLYRMLDGEITEEDSLV